MESRGGADGPVTAGQGGHGAGLAFPLHVEWQTRVCWHCLLLY